MLLTMDFDYTEEPWRTEAYHLIRELVGMSVMSLEGEDRKSWGSLVQAALQPVAELNDDGQRSRLLAHTVYEAVGLIDEILLEAATAQVQSAASESGTVATDPLSLAPEILLRRRQLWRTLMAREQLD